MKKRISRRYTYKKLKLDYLMQIMELFHPEELILEIFSTDKLSYLKKRMSDKEKVLFTEVIGERVNVLVSANYDKSFVNTLEEILNVNPKRIVLYFIRMPIKELYIFCYNKAVHGIHPGSRPDKSRFCIIPDENAIKIDYDAKMFQHLNLDAKTCEIFENAIIPDCEMRKEKYNQNRLTWQQKLFPYKYNKLASKSYDYAKIGIKGMIRMLELFHAQRFIIEISNISRNSILEKEIIEKKNIIFTEMDKGWVDFVIYGCLDESFARKMDEIIKANPEMITIYLTDFSPEKFFGYCFRKAVYEECSPKPFDNGRFYIRLDECEFSILYNKEVFDQPDFSLKLDEIYRS